MGNFVSQGAIAGRLTQHLATKYTFAERSSSLARLTKAPGCNVLTPDSLAVAHRGQSTYFASSKPRIAR